MAQAVLFGPRMTSRDDHRSSTLEPLPAACVSGPIGGEPQDGDLVVVRASSMGADDDARSWMVMTWGSPVIEHPELVGIGRDAACAGARLRAYAGGRRAWEARDGGFARLRLPPLVRQGVGRTYSISADVTDAESPHGVTHWQGYALLSIDDAHRLLGDMGFSPEQSTALLARAVPPTSR